jgi:AcrR family transcriptional regulator
MTVHQRSEETHARILQAAAECFTRGGYDATGVAEICGRAGISKGAFYHHFPTKQAVFLALLAQWLNGLQTAMDRLVDTGQTVPERLRAVGALAGGMMADATGQVPLFLEFWRQAAKDPEVWQATVAPYRHYRQRFAGLIAQGVAEGSLRPVDTQAAALTVVSLGVGLVLQAAVEPEGRDWGEAAQSAITLLLEGLAADGHV